MGKLTTTYHKISRSEWEGFYQNGVSPLSKSELEQLKGLNDRISLTDVEEIYVPLTHLIHLYIGQYEMLQASKLRFLQKEVKRSPYIIGIAGSVAVGKSTTARLLQMMLSRMFKEKNVQLITTDGFLYPNDVLEEKGIMDKKGFPESYDMARLIAFLGEVKDGQRHVKAPLYSHEIYNIVPDEYEEIDAPDILIVEGINVLQSPANQQIYISDFFDFSIFVDAEPERIEEWYLERFGLLLDTAFTDPTNYYYPYAIGDREEAFEMARGVWKTVNLVNLHEYILPTRNRADLVIHKTVGHKIDTIYLRKY